IRSTPVCAPPSRSNATGRAFRVLYSTASIFMWMSHLYTMPTWLRPQWRSLRQRSASPSKQLAPVNRPGFPARHRRLTPPTGAAMGVRQIRQFCALDSAGERLLEQAMRHYGLSARAHDRIRKVARTIADLAGAETITAEHLSEAIQYRTLDRA